LSPLVYTHSGSAKTLSPVQSRVSLIHDPDFTAQVPVGAAENVSVGTKFVASTTVILPVKLIITRTELVVLLMGPPVEELKQVISCALFTLP
jgi:hypothetical protein